MHHTVAERRGGDEPALGVVDEEVGVACGRVRAFQQLSAQVKQVLFHIELECAHAGLAARRLLERQQAFKRGDLAPEVAALFAHALL